MKPEHRVRCRSWPYARCDTRKHTGVGSALTLRWKKYRVGLAKRGSRNRPMTQVRAIGEPASTWYSSPPCKRFLYLKYSDMKSLQSKICKRVWANFPIRPEYTLQGRWRSVGPFARWGPVRWIPCISIYISTLICICICICICVLSPGIHRYRRPDLGCIWSGMAKMMLMFCCNITIRNPHIRRSVCTGV